MTDDGEKLVLSGALLVEDVWEAEDRARAVAAQEGIGYVDQLEVELRAAVAHRRAERAAAEASRASAEREVRRRARRRDDRRARYEWAREKLTAEGKPVTDAAVSRLLGLDDKYKTIKRWRDEDPDLGM